MMHLTSVDLPAPFSPSSAWNEPASTLIETSSSATSGPKILVMPTVSSDGARTGSPVTFCANKVHGSASRKVADVATAPNTPPCILIMSSAARWFSTLVAAQQSSSSRHS